MEAKQTKKTKLQEVEDYINLSYEFRYNTIKQKPEYLENNIWKPLDKYKLLSIKRELDSFNLIISKDSLLDILCSDFAPAVNPVKNYFENLQKYDNKKDYIKELCNTITTKNDDEFYIYFKKWITAVVANIFIDNYCANHTCLVLTGEQGKYKTSWLENLIPKELSSYNYTGKLNLESKDTLTYLAEYFIINIDDQLKQLHKKDENELKNLITINSVKYRKPYDHIITEYPHLASFCASVNGNDFLNDPTGSRRFLPFEVLDIDIKKAQKLDLTLIYSQALHLFNNKFEYWFNEEDINKLNKRNDNFSIISVEEELISNYYKPEITNRNVFTGEITKYLTSSMILVDLEIKTRQRLNKKKLGEALNKLRFEKKQKTIDNSVKWVYKIIEKSTDTIEAQHKEEIEQPEIF